MISKSFFSMTRSIGDKRSRLRKSKRVIKPVRRFPFPPKIEEFVLIKDKFSIGIHQCEIKDANIFVLDTDDWFDCPELDQYYGPSKLGHVFKFQDVLNEQIRMGKKVLLRIQFDRDNAINVLLLSSFYLMLELAYSPKESFQKIRPLLSLVPKKFYKTEGSPSKTDLKISILHCLFGMKTFMDNDLLRIDQLNIASYEEREDPSLGDMNWVIPGKILALAGPSEDTCSIEQFTEYALDTNVRALVRLNSPEYEVDHLLQNGISHIHMYMEDGTVPSLDQISQFYHLADEILEDQGALAVHCRAGLGRTGTMIATYLIRKYGFKTAHVIAYLRMMRAGMILSYQARYLEHLQTWLRDEPVPKRSRKFLAEFHPEFKN